MTSYEKIGAGRRGHPPWWYPRNAHRDPESANGKWAGGDRLAPLIYGDPELRFLDARRGGRRSFRAPLCIAVSPGAPNRYVADWTVRATRSTPDIINASRVLPMFPPRKTGRFMHEHVAAFEFFGEPFEARARRERETDFAQISSLLMCEKSGNLAAPTFPSYIGPV
jgi:hypothetical protein